MRSGATPCSTHRSNALNTSWSGSTVERVGAIAETVRSGPAAAMSHAGHQEQPVEVLDGPRALRSRIWIFGEKRPYAVVVLDRARRRNRGIAPAVILNQLAAERAERAQVRTGGVQDRTRPWRRRCARRGRNPCVRSPIWDPRTRRRRNSCCRTQTEWRRRPFAGVIHAAQAPGTASVPGGWPVKIGSHVLGFFGPL